MVHYRRFLVQLAATGILAGIALMIGSYLTWRILIMDQRTTRQDATEAEHRARLDSMLGQQRLILERLDALYGNRPRRPATEAP